MDHLKDNMAAEAANAAEADRKIPFIDAHHHVWELGRFHYRWLDEPGTPGHNERLGVGEYRSIRRDWTMGRILREFYGSNVVKSVHVEADYSGPDPVEETAWLESVANEGGFPHALVVFCDLERSDAEAQLVRHMEASPRTRGVRLRAHPDDPDTRAFRAGYAALGRHGLSYELNASPGGLLAGRDAARAHPDVPMILGHAGFPERRGADYSRLWRSEISALAEAPNVACKVSGLAMVDHEWTIESIRPWVLHCIEAFGVDRVMFGTNWPVDAPFSSYLRQVDAYRLILAREGFSRADQESLLHHNAERFYRI